MVGFLHGRRGGGGGTVKIGRGEMPSAGAIAGVDSCSGHGEEGEGEMPLPSFRKVTDWAPQPEVLGFNLDRNKMKISLPPRNVRELKELREEWLEGRRPTTAREVLALAGKLPHVAYVIRPGSDFVRRLLQLNKLPLNGHEKTEGRRSVGEE